MRRRNDCGQLYWRKEIFRAFSSATIAVTIRSAAWSIAVKFALARGIVWSAIFFEAMRWSDERRRGCVTRARFSGFALQRRITKYRWNSRNRRDLHFSTRKDRYILYLSILSHWLKIIFRRDCRQFYSSDASSAKSAMGSNIGNISRYVGSDVEIGAAEKINLQIASWHVEMYFENFVSRNWNLISDFIVTKI